METQAEPRRYVMCPTLAKFHADDTFVRGILGPIGSGKSVGCTIEIFLRAQMQKPYNGVRYSRWAVIRSTYPELKSTTIKTWKEWVPESICPIRYDVPITGKLAFPLSDGTKVEAEILFLAMDQAADVKKVLSMEITGAWLNEAREFPSAIPSAVASRCGRYPGKAIGGCTWRGLIMDTNSPDDDHWWYKRFEGEGTEGWKLFHQPPAVLKKTAEDGKVTWEVNPNAENLENLDEGYYSRQIPGNDEGWIRIYLQAKYGQTFEGRPVWPEFNEDRHVAKEPLKPIPGAPLLLGWDYGLTPSCVFGQLSAKGQLLILEEHLGESIGIKNMILNTVRPAIVSRWRGYTIHSWGDPAGAQRTQTDERTCFEELAALGIPTESARTNAFAARRESVASFLTRSIEGGHPGFLLDPRIVKLRKGLAGGYFFKRVKVSANEEAYKDEPVKNMASHICDALQYLCLGADPDLDVRRARSTPIAVKGVTAKGWV